MTTEDPDDEQKELSQPPLDWSERRKFKNTEAPKNPDRSVP